jgi:hypothetical protein
MDSNNKIKELESELRKFLTTVKLAFILSVDKRKRLSFDELNEMLDTYLHEQRKQHDEQV